MITLYENDLETAIADLNNVIVDNDIQIEKVINNIDILSLTTRIEEFKTDKINEKNAIKVDNQFYRINDITKSHRTNVPTLKIECEHIMYDLNEESIRELKIVDKDNREVLELLLKDTDFKVGKVDQTINHNLIYSDVSVRSALIDFANTNNLEIIFDNYVVSLVKTIGKSAGFAVEFGKNVLGIEKIYESGSQPGYEIDLVELSNTEEYKQLKLEQFESVDVGDQIIITDRAIRISDERQTVIGITYNPLERVNTKLQIARKIKNFAETMARNELETEKEIKEIQSNVESLSGGSAGISMEITRRLEMLEANNAYLIGLINNGITKDFTNLGMKFEDGILTDTTIVKTLEDIKLNNNDWYPHIPSHSCSFNVKQEWRPDVAEYMYLFNGEDSPIYSFAPFEMEYPLLFVGSDRPASVECGDETKPLLNIDKVVKEYAYDNKYLTERERVGFCIFDTMKPMLVTIANTYFDGGEYQRVTFRGKGEVKTLGNKCSNLVYRNQKFFILDNGKIKYTKSKNIDDDTIGNDFIFKLVSINKKMRDIVSFSFIDDSNLIIAYDNGKKIAKGSINGTMTEIKVPETFQADSIFILDEPYVYDVNNNKIYNIKEDNIIYYTGLNITYPIKNGNVATVRDTTMLYYFKEGEMRGIRKIK